MDCFKVNLDYESCLFDPHYRENASKSLAMIKEFEYVFFLINQEKCSLKNFSIYDESYLQHLHRIGLVIPELTPETINFINWWGPQKNIELEKKLNSKITSASVAKEKNWGMFNAAIVENKLQALDFIEAKPDCQWILKNPYGVSGSGHLVYSSQDFQGPHLLEPIYKRVFDIGTTFEMVNGEIHNTFMVENLNSKNGSFKGGVGARNREVFKKYIKNKYDFDLSELEVITQEICNIYRQMGATSNLQIDSFIYFEGSTLKLYPLVEVNYRKTMGLVINRLAKIFNADLIEWRVTHTNEYEEQSNWIKLSPGGKRFNSYAHII